MDATLDVKAAFLTVPLDVELDVILPEGFVLAGSTAPSTLAGAVVRSLLFLDVHRGHAFGVQTCWRPSIHWGL